MTSEQKEAFLNSWFGSIPENSGHWSNGMSGNIVDEVSVRFDEAMKAYTRAVPDVPELVTVGHLWEYAEYHSDDSGYYGYVKIITEENPSTHVSPASKIRRHSELVTRDQAAAIIEAKDAEIERWREQYREAVRNAFKDSGAALSGKEQS